MISEVQHTASQTGDGRLEQRTKYKNMSKNPKGDQHVFESFINRASTKLQIPQSSD
jgi:hypothetical protein